MADPYCVLTDIQAAIPTFTFGAATVPTDTQVTAYCALVTSEIDGALRAAGYALPVTDSDALAQLKTLCVYGTCALTLKAKFPVKEGVGGDGGAVEFFETRYNAAMARIADGSLAVDEERDSGRFGEGFTVNADGEAYEPFATRDMEF